MDKSGRVWTLVLLCLLYVWIGDNQVHGKCAGKWSIHACRGGNGKRSEATRVSADRDSLGGRGDLDTRQGALGGLEAMGGYDRMKTLDELLMRHARNNLKKQELLEGLKEAGEMRVLPGEGEGYRPEGEGLAPGYGYRPSDPQEHGLRTSISPGYARVLPGSSTPDDRGLPKSVSYPEYKEKQYHEYPDQTILIEKLLKLAHLKNGEDI